MASGSVHCCVTSPPYFGLRDYGVEGQIGLEETPDAYVAKMVEVFSEVRRVLRDDGTLWLNLGDSYAGSWGNAGGHNRGSGTQREITVGSVVKDQAERNGAFVPPAANGYSELGIKKKDLIGIPWRVAFALQADGWYLRQDIIWHKPNPMPESVKDRCTKAHEYIFLLSKSEKYFFDHEAMKEPAVTGWNGSEFHTGKTGEHQLGRSSSNRKPRPAGNKSHKYVTEYEQTGNTEHRTKAGLLKQAGVIYETRNRRSVWTVTTKPFRGTHFATFPPDLIRPCILAGCPKGGTVMDPFGGSGTTAQVALQEGRRSVLCELNPDYIQLAHKRVGSVYHPTP